MWTMAESGGRGVRDARVGAPIQHEAATGVFRKYSYRRVRKKFYDGQDGLPIGIGLNYMALR